MESQSGKLFVGGIAHQTTELNLRGHFAKFGEITECIILREKYTGVGRGFGFVSFADSSVVENVLKEEHEILGKKVDVKQAKPKLERNQNKPQHDNELSMNNFREHNNSELCNNKIFVGGLPPTLTLKEFDNYFKKFGTITDKVMMYNKEINKPRGFGFITFNCENAAKKVMENRFHELKNKQVEVKWAEPPKDCNNSVCTYVSSDPRLGFGIFGNSEYYEPHYPIYNPYGYSVFAPIYGYYWITTPYLISGSNLETLNCVYSDVGNSSGPSQDGFGFGTSSPSGTSKDVCTRKNDMISKDNETIENGNKSEVSGERTLENGNTSKINDQNIMDMSEVNGKNGMENGEMSAINGEDNRSMKHYIMVPTDNGVCSKSQN